MLQAETNPYQSGISSIVGTVTSNADLNGTGVDVVDWIDSSASSIDAVESFSVALTPGFNYGIGFTSTFGGTVQPLSASLSSGYVLTVFFGAASPNLLSPGLGTEGIIIQSNAPSYMNGSINLLDRAPAASSTYVGTTPEPSTLAQYGGLAGLCIGFRFLRLTRTKKAAQA
jgi:hypothetical protein